MNAGGSCPRASRTCIQTKHMCANSAWCCTASIAFPTSGVQSAADVPRSAHATASLRVTCQNQLRQRLLALRVSMTLAARASMWLQGAHQRKPCLLCKSSLHLLVVACGAARPVAQMHLQVETDMTSSDSLVTLLSMGWRSGMSQCACCQLTKACKVEQIHLGQ